jgi:hypothetical protein
MEGVEVYYDRSDLVVVGKRGIKANAVVIKKSLESTREMIFFHDERRSKFCSLIEFYELVNFWGIEILFNMDIRCSLIENFGDRDIDKHYKLGMRDDNVWIFILSRLFFEDVISFIRADVIGCPHNNDFLFGYELAYNNLDLAEMYRLMREWSVGF